MKRRLGAWTAAIALILALLPAARAGAAAIAVKSPGGPVKAGENFTVTVELTGNPGFNAVQFTLGFDKSKMECTEISNGSLLGRMMSASNPRARSGAKVAAASAANVNGDGIFITASFTALTDIESFDFTLSDVELADETGSEIPYTVTGATEVKPAPAQTPTPTSGTTPAEGEGESAAPAEGTGEADKSAPEQTQSAPEQAAPADESTPAPTSGAADAPAVDAVYTDTAGHWGASWIAKAAAKGIFTGYPDGSFKPDAAVTRGDLVLTLYRMAGKPAVSGAAPFADVPADAYYADAVAWAYGAGYVSGRGDGFDPTAPVTRQEAMKILFAASGGQSGMEAMFTSIYDEGFADSAQIADWARSAMYWAYFNEIINGMDGGLAPNGKATRAQLAKILVEYAEKIKNK